MSDWTMPDWLRRLARPREGWLAYFLLVVMLFSLAWSVQSALRLCRPIASAPSVPQALPPGWQRFRALR